MLLPLNNLLRNKKTYRREEQEVNIIYLGKIKDISGKEIEAIMMENIISGDKWIWNPSYKDLKADDYIEVTEEYIKSKKNKKGK